MVTAANSGRGLVDRWRNTLALRPGLKAVIHNTGWLMFDRMIRLLLGLFVGAWVARFLGPAQFGTLAYVVAFIAIFQAIAKLGADSIVVRDIVHAPEKAGHTLGTLFALRLFAGLIGWVVAILVVTITNPDDNQLILLTAIVGATVVFQAADTIDLWFQSQSQSRRTVLSKLAAYGLANGLKVILILAGASLTAFAFTIMLEFLLAAIGLFVAYRRFPTRDRWTFTSGFVRHILSQSWPFLLSSLSIIIYMRIDQIMLKSIRGEHELGIYAAALPLSQLWQAIPITLATSLAPYVARKKLEGPEAYEQSLLYVFRLVGGLSLGASIVTALSAPFIIPFLYGPTYAAAIDVLIIHVFSNVFIALGVAQGLWAANDPAGGRVMFVKTLCGGAASIAINIIVIPRWGAMGAAMTAVIAQFLAAVLSNVALAPTILHLQLGIKKKHNR